MSFTRFAFLVWIFGLSLLPAPYFALQAAAGKKSKASELAKPDQVVEYKKVGETVLNLDVFNPPGHKASDKTPAIE